MGLYPKGEPQIKKLKFIKIFNQLVQVNESILHLFLRSLSLKTDAIDLVDSAQCTATPLQFLNDFKISSILFFIAFLKSSFLPRLLFD